MNVITNLFTRTQIQDKELLNATYKSTTEFSLWGYKANAKALRVEGTVIWFAFRLAGGIHKFRTRLANIDIADIFTKNAEELKVARKAEARIAELLSDKIVEIQLYKSDPNGNILVDVSVDGKNVSETLIEEKLAYHWYGGSKKAFDMWYSE